MVSYRLDSAENMSVKERIREEIVVGKENSYSSLLVNSDNHMDHHAIFLEAIKRYYESRRRIWREGQSPQKNRVESQAKKRKVRSRCLRVSICQFN